MQEAHFCQCRQKKRQKEAFSLLFLPFGIKLFGCHVSLFEFGLQPFCKSFKFFNTKLAEELEGKRPDAAREGNDKEISHSSGNKLIAEEKIQGASESLLDTVHYAESDNKLDHLSVPSALGVKLDVVFIKRIYKSKTEQTACKSGRVLTCAVKSLLLIIKNEGAAVKKKHIDDEAYGNKHTAKDDPRHRTLGALLCAEDVAETENEKRRNTERCSNVKGRVNSKVHSGEGNEENYDNPAYLEPALSVIASEAATPKAL